MRPSEHSDASTLTRPAYDLPAPRARPCAGLTPAWQPALAQLAVKIGCTAPANETLAPHEHAPAEQTWPGAHAWPQAPQLAGSDEVFTQEPPQTDWPAGQAQAPAEHVAPEAQAFAQPPQLAGSVAVLTQAPLQDDVPGGHAQEPFTQEAPPAQAIPHPPQLAAFVVVSTHAPLQFFVGGLQEPEQTPALQTSFRGHTLPHVPQFFGSDFTSTQPPQALAVPAGHPHLPALHVPPGQAMPQPPQFAGSARVSVHLPPQGV